MTTLRNFPFMMLAWKVAPAIACGNAVIVKSAEQTPLSALYFGKLVQEANAPAGLINLISGFGKEAGAALAGHLDVDKVAFTGSTNTGRTIMKAAASNLKNITLECGGKSPLLVFADANLEQAVKWSHVGGMFNQGEVGQFPNVPEFMDIVPHLNRQRQSLTFTSRSAQRRHVYMSRTQYTTSS